VNLRTGVRSGNRVRTFLAFVLTVGTGLWCTAGCNPDGTIVEREYLAVRMDDGLIGHLMVTGPLTWPWNEQPAERLHVLSRLTYAVLGTTKNLQSQVELYWAPDGGALIGYDGFVTIGETTTRARCEVDGTKAKLTTEVVGVSSKRIKRLDVTGPLVVAAANDPSLLFQLIHLLRGAVFGEAVAAGAPAGAPAGAAQAAAGSMTVTTIDVQTGKTGSLELSLLADREVDIGGKRRLVRGFVLASQAEVLFDARTGRMLRVEQPGSGVTFEVAGPEIVARAAAAAAAAAAADSAAGSAADSADAASASTTGPLAVLGGRADAFSRAVVSSNVRFVLPKTVRNLRVRLDVGVLTSEDCTVAVSSTMQRFSGTVSHDRITGEAVITSERISGPTWPLPVPTNELNATLRKLIEPSLFIESDDQDIVEQSRKILDGCRTAAEAVQRVGHWVARNVDRGAIGDSPSAKLALVRRSGDCGPHAALTVALLRAASIPSRLVGGLLYDGSLEAFGQHAWVEAAVGPDRFVTIDPMTDEMDGISAVHILCFHGMGGVRPQRLEVIDYGPVVEAPPLQPAGRPLPWTVGDSWTWRYTKDGTDFGTETVSVEAPTEADVQAQSSDRTSGAVRAPGTRRTPVTENAGPRFVLTSTTDLHHGILQLHVERRIVVTATGSVLSWHTDGRAGDVSYELTASFTEKAVRYRARRTGAPPVERTIDGPVPWPAENNCLACWMLHATQFDLHDGATVSVPVLWLDRLRTVTLVMTARKDTGGRMRLAVEPIASEFHLNEAGGRLVSMTGPGGLLIQRQP